MASFNASSVSCFFMRGPYGNGFEKENYYLRIYDKISRTLKERNNFLILIRGNHDNPEYFSDGKIDFPLMKTLPDYSILRFSKKHVLCIGGAISIDRKYRQGKMWLDIKNLTAGNKHVALERMNEMTEYFQIAKDRLIIEGKDWKALEVFTQDGYYTSYYVTYDEPDDLSEEEVDDCIEELQEIADKEVVSALSFPGYWYTEIKEGLNRSIDLLTWKHRSSQLQFLLSSVGREMLADPQLKVVLVKEKGRFHR